MKNPADVLIDMLNKCQNVYGTVEICKDHNNKPKAGDVIMVHREGKPITVIVCQVRTLKNSYKLICKCPELNDNLSECEHE